MAKPELGTKRTCPVTGRKFYDLNNDPIVSPFTGERYPRSYFEPAARTVARPEPESADAGDDEETAAEVISLEEADAESASSSKVSVSDDADADDDLDDGDDDAFLEEDEDDNDDVSDLIGDGLEEDEEG